MIIKALHRPNISKIYDYHIPKEDDALDERNNMYQER